MDHSEELSSESTTQYDQIPLPEDRDQVLLPSTGVSSSQTLTTPFRTHQSLGQVLSLPQYSVDRHSPHSQQPVPSPTNSVTNHYPSTAYHPQIPGGPCNPPVQPPHSSYPCQHSYQPPFPAPLSPTPNYLSLPQSPVNPTPHTMQPVVGIPTLPQTSNGQFNYGQMDYGHTTYVPYPSVPQYLPRRPTAPINSRRPSTSRPSTTRKVNSRQPSTPQPPTVSTLRQSDFMGSEVTLAK